jgi:hypothetical protein
MRTLHIFKRGTPQGDIELKLAFEGKIIAIKGQNNPTAQQFIQQYRQKGAVVIEKRDGVLVNIFPAGKTFFKLGQIEIDLEKDSSEVIENKLCAFYIDTFSKAGFQVE